MIRDPGRRYSGANTVVVACDYIVSSLHYEIRRGVRIGYIMEAFANSDDVYTTEQRDYDPLTPSFYVSRFAASTFIYTWPTYRHKT